MPRKLPRVCGLEVPQNVLPKLPRLFPPRFWELVEKCEGMTPVERKEFEQIGKAELAKLQSQMD